MKNVIKKICAISLTSLLFTGCGDSSEENQPKPQTVSKQLLSDSLALTVKPENAVTVSDARKVVEPGKTVTVFGTIGGTVSPFVDKRASFVLADHTTMKACRTEACTSCPTPWDFCCTPKEILSKSILTVQFVDEKGAVIKQGLESFKGLEKNGVVVIKGKFAPTATKDLVIINAESFFVEK